MRHAGCWRSILTRRHGSKTAPRFSLSCHELDVPAALERSRSGNGGHVWIFFERAIPATTARKLGCAILTRTMESRHQVGLDSYDRFFPNQDTMPKGGLGNLIALPLQKVPRANGNSVFVNAEFHPYPDQWGFLASVKRMSTDAVEAVVLEAQRRGDLIGVRISIAEDEDKIPGRYRRHKREWSAKYQDLSQRRYKSFAPISSISRKWSAFGDVKPAATLGSISKS